MLTVFCAGHKQFLTKKLVHKMCKFELSCRIRQHQNATLGWVIVDEVPHINIANSPFSVNEKICFVCIRK
jgi:hypothetical protein